MTRIDLPGGFYITTDELNYILKREYPSEKKPGKMIERSLAFYSIHNLRGAMTAFFKHYMVEYADGFQGDIFGYIERLEQGLQEAVEKTLEGVKNE